VLAITLGALLRLWFIAHAATISGDTFLYGDIALSWMQHGIYGFSQSPAQPIPTLIRLPGYPLFLVLCFRLFGLEHYTPVLYLQCIIDLSACLLLAALVRRLFGGLAALLALSLAALCPFTASYTAAALTETLTGASITLALYALERWRPKLPTTNSPTSPLERNPVLRWNSWTPWNRWAWVVSAALAASILLRPDQGLLAVAILPAMLWLNLDASSGRPPERIQTLGRVILSKAKGAKSKHLRFASVPAASLLKQILPPLAVALCTLLPLVPWTIRNARTFHVFQPLAPRSAVDPGQPVPTGFYRWYRTWGLDFASTEDIYWNYDGVPISIAELPTRAFDSSAQFTETAALLDAYNLTARPTPEIDARFNDIAARRIHASAPRYFVALPVARLTNMLLRPRIEMLPISLAWWRWHEHRAQTAFALAYAALNLAYLVFGSLGLYRWVRRPNDPSTPIAWAMIAYIALRCALLLTLDNSEPRYTLEFFPIFIVGIASLIHHPESNPHGTVILSTTQSKGPASLVCIPKISPPKSLTAGRKSFSYPS